MMRDRRAGTDRTGTELETLELERGIGKRLRGFLSGFLGNWRHSRGARAGRPRTGRPWLAVLLLMAMAVAGAWASESAAEGQQGKPAAGRKPDAVKDGAGESSVAMESDKAKASGPESNRQERVKEPGAEDELAIVRARARLLDSQLRYEEAARAAEQAQQDFAKAKAEFESAVSAAETKLPKAPTGKQWAIQDDQQFGVTFALRDTEKR